MIVDESGFGREDQGGSLGGESRLVNVEEWVNLGLGEGAQLRRGSLKHEYA